MMSDMEKSELTFAEPVDWSALTETERDEVLKRPAVAAGARITEVVTGILADVEKRGDEALRELSAKFDRVAVKAMRVEDEAVEAAWNRATPEFRAALQTAADNIRRFHTAEKLAQVTVETMPGVTCTQVTRPIASVGLYIPGGTAPLFSTVLMLGIPASIAGCNKVILCSPPPVADPILCAAKLCGIKDIYQVGGAQAIAAMAFGTDSIPKVAKIFGPGNAYVTEAKRQVSRRTDGAAIDMPAGPSEVLVIADEAANPAFVAADLLSQAEHGPDSQVVLVTPSETLAKAAAAEALRQLQEYYDTKLNTHNCADLVELTMSLYAKKKKTEAQKRKFGAIDERYMKRAEDLLFGELSAALEIPKGDVRQYIHDRLQGKL